jgi:hypothetical protein
MGRKGRMFFFEKKNQKTFLTWLRAAGERPLQSGNLKDKSFLLLFFKKEESSFPQAHPAYPHRYGDHVV